MELEVLFSGMCLFTENGNGWQVRVIDGKNPQGRKKSRDSKAGKRTVLHDHEAELWVEIGNPAGGRPPDSDEENKTELSPNEEVPVKVYRLSGREELSFAILDAAGNPVALPAFQLDPTFEANVASLSAIDTTVAQASLRAVGVSPLAALIELEHGVLSSKTDRPVQKWEGTHLAAQPQTISTSALWRLSALGEKVRIRSSRRNQDIEITPEGDTVRLWIVSYPPPSEHHDHPSASTAGHFKWFYELFDFNGTSPADELAHPVPPQVATASVGNTTFCPETRS